MKTSWCMLSVYFYMQIILSKQTNHCDTKKLSLISIPDQCYPTENTSCGRVHTASENLGYIPAAWNQQVEVYCSLEQAFMQDHGVSSTDILFTFFFREYLCPIRGEIEVVNQTQARLIIPNITQTYIQQMCGENSLCCTIDCLVHRKKESAVFKVRSEYLVLGNKPQVPQNVQVEIFNWTDFYISWDFNQCLESFETNYTVYWRYGKGEWESFVHTLPGTTCLFSVCNFSERLKCCTQSEAKRPEVLAKPFTFESGIMDVKIIGVNPLGQVKTAVMSFYSDDKVRPSKGQTEATVSVVNSTSALLTITQPYFRDRMNYIVILTSSWHNINKTILSDDPKPDVTSVLTGLHPYTHYNMEVLAQPERSQLFTRSSIYSLDTLMDVPAAAPEVSSNNFEIVRLNKTMRSIIVYWKRLPVSDANGIVEKYIVSVLSDQEEYSKTVSGDTTHFTIENNPTSQRLHVTVTAKTSVGVNETLEKDVVVIPSQQNIPLIQAPHVVTHNATTAEIRWVYDEIAKTFTVYWCKATYRDQTCQTPLQWKVVPGVERAVFIPLTQSKVKTMFGLAVTRLDSLNSGIQWNKCFYTKDLPTPELELVDSSKETLTVRILVNKCYWDAIKIFSMFKLSWCQLRGDICHGEIRLTNISTDLNVVNIQNGIETKLSELSPSETYQVNVTGVSYDGEMSMTKIQQLTTEKEGHAGILIAIIVPICVIVLILLILLGFIIHKKCRGKIPIDSALANQDPSGHGSNLALESYYNSSEHHQQEAGVRSSGEPAPALPLRAKYMNVWGDAPARRDPAEEPLLHKRDEEEMVTISLEPQPWTNPDSGPSDYCQTRQLSAPVSMDTSLNESENSPPFTVTVPQFKDNSADGSGSHSQLKPYSQAEMADESAQAADESTDEADQSGFTVIVPTLPLPGSPTQASNPDTYSPDDIHNAESSDNFQLDSVTEINSAVGSDGPDQYRPGHVLLNKSESLLAKN